MRILVIGGGGREHALVWKLRQSPRVSKIYAAPGNAGIAESAECADISVTDVRLLAGFAERHAVDLTVVGPELPPTLGVVDEFERRGLPTFGPRREAAVLEGSKVFAKRFMKRHGIPTGYYQTFGDAEDARRFIRDVGAPIVVKADGLAAGKGVVVCHTVEEAMGAIALMMESHAFGDAGAQIVVEEFLQGEEASVLAVTDGTTVVPLPAAQDHKAALDQDRGPNTGGMGAYSPAPVVTEDVRQKVVDRILAPTVKGMAAEGRPYRGILYAGLMIHGGEPRALEFNARFGDPEAQAILVRMASDLVPVLEATIEERLDEVEITWRPDPAVCVVLAAAGYPGGFERGKPIEGLAAAGRLDQVVVFHAGTALREGQVVTAGGRVLGVTGWDATLAGAIQRAYGAVGLIRWDGMHFRTDIGRKALIRGGA